jgi:hypothetical protein
MWGCLALLIAMPVGIFLRAVALSWLWLWFVVPFGIVQISLPWALGLSTLMHAFAGSPSSERDDDDSKKPGEKAALAVMLIVGNPIFALAVGYVIHAWM